MIDHTYTIFECYFLNHYNPCPRRNYRTVIRRFKLDKRYTLRPFQLVFPISISTSTINRIALIHDNYDYVPTTLLSIFRYVGYPMKCKGNRLVY